MGDLSTHTFISTVTSAPTTPLGIWIFGRLTISFWFSESWLNSRLILDKRSSLGSGTPKQTKQKPSLWPLWYLRNMSFPTNRATEQFWANYCLTDMFKMCMLFWCCSQQPCHFCRISRWDFWNYIVQLHCDIKHVTNCPFQRNVCKRGTFWPKNSPAPNKTK